MLMVQHRHRSISRMVASCLVALVLTALGMAAAPAPASAATCTYYTDRLFPGSYPSGVRYGEVNFSFEACSDQSPSAWVMRVTKQQVNATGQNLGFFINGAFVRVDGSGSSYKYFTGLINASSCTPRVGWPCSRSYTFTAEYTVYLDRYGRPNITLGRRTAPSGMRLYTTP